MKRTTVDFLKNILLSVLFAYMLSRLSSWVTREGAMTCSAGFGIFLWFYLTAYDEILRKRRKSRRKMILQQN